MVTKTRKSRGKLPQHRQDGLAAGAPKAAAKAKARQKAATADDKLYRAMTLAGECHSAYLELYNGRRRQPRSFEMLQGKALLATVNLLDHVLKDHQGIHDYIRTLTQPKAHGKPDLRVEILPPDFGDDAFDITDHLPEQFVR